MSEKRHTADQLTYDLEEAADFLKVSPATVIERAGKGEIPGAKYGKAWVFLRDDLVAHLRAVVDAQVKARRAKATPRRGGGRRREIPDLPELGGDARH